MLHSLHKCKMAVVQLFTKFQGTSYFCSCWLIAVMPRATTELRISTPSAREEAVIHEMSCCQSLVGMRACRLCRLSGRDGTLLKPISWQRSKWLIFLLLSRMSCTPSKSHHSLLANIYICCHSCLHTHTQQNQSRLWRKTARKLKATFGFIILSHTPVISSELWEAEANQTATKQTRCSTERTLCSGSTQLPHRRGGTKTDPHALPC